MNKILKSFSYVIGSLCILSVSSCSDSGNSAGYSEKELNHLKTKIAEKTKSFTEAHITRDTAFLNTCFTNDARVYPPYSNPVVGVKDISALNAEWVSYSISEFNETSTSFYGSGELLIDEGLYRLVYGEEKTVDEGKYVNIWKNVEGDWKLYSNIWNASASSATSVNTAQDELKFIIDQILFAAGNYDHKLLEKYMTTDATLHISAHKEDGWKTRVLNVQEYYDRAMNSSDLMPFAELPVHYDYVISQEGLASVKAEAILHRFGKSVSREFNHFTLIKQGLEWRCSDISWIVEPMPEEQKVFDIEIFAEGYARAWCSNRPNFVSMFFEESASLQINEGSPSIGRKEIANVARSFMTQFPDMIVEFDSLVYGESGVKFHWTLSGTDASPDGNGHFVKFSGYELWVMSDEGLIENSMGHFSAEEYSRQLEHGIK